MYNERRGHPTSTAMQSRLPMVSANKRQSTQAILLSKDSDELNIKVIENKWGKLTFSGKRLTQTHRDIMDWLFTFHRTKEEQGDGSCAFGFNPYGLMRDMGIKSPHMEHLVKWLNEMKSADIKIETKDFVTHTVIITEHGYEKTGKQSHKFGNGENYEVVFSRKFMQFFEHDINVYYSTLLLPLLEIRDANLRAIARWFFTHEKMDIGLIKLLNHLNVLDVKDVENIAFNDFSKYQKKIIRDIRQEINQVRTKTVNGKEVEYKIFDDFGIYLDDNDVFHYLQHKSIWIDNFQNTPASKTQESKKGR